jgi:hypothetical protein
MLHPDNDTSEKNRGGMIPDIVTVKNGLCLFFENKDRVVIDDFQKAHELIINNRYTNSISNLLKGYNIDRILYGVGFPKDMWNSRASENASLVDFIAGVAVDGDVEFLYNPGELSL